MQEGGPPKRPAVGKGGCPFGGIEHELHLAVLDRVHNVWAPFQNFIDFTRRHAVLSEITLGSRGRYDPEAEANQESNRLDHPRLIGILDRHEYGSLPRQPRAAADLAFGECNWEISIDAHDLARRFHLRSENRIHAG